MHDAIRGVGTYARAMSAVRALKAAGLKPLVQMVIHRLNSDTIEDYMAQAAAIGDIAVAVTRLAPQGRGSKLRGMVLNPDETRRVFFQLEALAQEYPNIQLLRGRDLWVLVNDHYGGSCSAGLANINILHDGTVYACRRLPIPLGNILRQDIFEIWYCSPLLWTLRDRDNLKGHCRRCDRCGGCCAIAHGVAGDNLHRTWSG